MIYAINSARPGRIRGGSACVRVLRYLSENHPRKVKLKMIVEDTDLEEGTVRRVLNCMRDLDAPISDVTTGRWAKWGLERKMSDDEILVYSAALGLAPCDAEKLVKLAERTFSVQR